MTVEWAAEQEVTAEQAAALIAARFPELAGAPVEPLAEGWDNVVHLVGGSWVFRFPRREIALPGIEREMTVLPRLAPHLSLRVPVPEWQGEPGPDLRWPFWGARLIEGRELADSGPDRTAAARGLGLFLHALHDPALPGRLGITAGLGQDPSTPGAVPPLVTPPDHIMTRGPSAAPQAGSSAPGPVRGARVAPRAGSSPSGPARVASRADLSSHGPGVVLPVDPLHRAEPSVRAPMARERLARLAAAGRYAENPAVDRLLAAGEDLGPAPGPPVICHGDLHARHLLVDGEGTATGVIDWGDLCLADPAVDLSLAYGGFTGAARRELLAAYSRPVGPDRELRARVLAVFLCAVLAEYAADVGARALLADSLAGLTRATED